MLVTTIERSAHLIALYLDQVLDDFPMTQGEAHVLSQLERRGPTSMGALHHEFGHRRSTLTNIVDRLESRGWVRREINRADRRSFLIQLTRSGRAPARRVNQVLDGLERRVLEATTTRDRNGLDAVSAVLAAVVHGRSTR
ncbi:MAG: MarR family winged helix-turn-helix transcriptional regulator [Solirubrobacteraceae bacterium]